MADSKTGVGKVLGAIAAPVIGLIGSIFGGSSARKGAEAQIAAAKQINQAKLDFAQRMWEQTNRYNTPKAQMQRFLDAGLNPNLIYGRGSSGSASMASTPDLDVPDVAAKYSAIGSIPEKALNYASIAASNMLLDSRRQNVEQDTANKAVENVLKTVKASQEKLSYKKQKELYETAVETSKKSLERINQDIRLRDAKNTREERIVDKTVDKLSREIENLRKKGVILSEEAMIKTIDRQLYQDFGLRPTDPHYMRIINSILQSLKGGQLPNIINPDYWKWK